MARTVTDREKAPTMLVKAQEELCPQLMEFYFGLPPTVKQRIKAVVSQRLAKEDDNHV